MAELDQFSPLKHRAFGLRAASPLLPEQNKRNILITSALPYVNNIPHLGNIIGCVLSADVFARYCKSSGYNALFISGTDEYGTATEARARAEQLSPQQICDKYFPIHRDIYEWFGIDFDYFGRTSTPLHTEITQQLFQRVRSNGFLTEQNFDQLYCEGHGSFLADRFVEGTCPKCGYVDARGDQCDSCATLLNGIELLHPKCKICNAIPIIRQTGAQFLSVDALQPQLNSWIDTSSHQWSTNAQGITNGWLKAELKPRCITRDLSWGVPVPLEGWEKKVFYVWFDAPIGYISITANYTDQWERWWKSPATDKVELVQFLGKDNVPFHSIFFPATLLAANDDWNLVSAISATEFLNLRGTKFNKGRGHAIFGSQAKASGVPADVWRWYLISIRPETADADFVLDDLIGHNNADLADTLGNFVNRTLKYIYDKLHHRVPKFTSSDAEEALEQNVNALLISYKAAFESRAIKQASRIATSIARLGNQYFQQQQPWELAKTDPVRLATVLSTAASLCRLLGLLFWPFTPYFAAELLFDVLRLPSDKYPQLPETFQLPFLPANHEISQPKPAFPRIDSTRAQQIQQHLENR